MRKHLLKTGLLLTVLALLVLAGRHAAADAPNVNAKPSPVRVNGDIYDQIESDLPLDKVSEWRAKIAVGPNSNATVTIDLITDGGSGNQTDDGVTSGTVSGQGTKIAVEVFALGVTTSLVGVRIEFYFDASVLKFDKAENSAFLFILPEATGASLAATAPVTLPSSGFLARAEFSTVADVTGREFTLGIKRVTLAESAASSDVVTTTDAIAFNATPSPDFDGDNMVGFSDFLAFAGQYGSKRGDGRYQAKYDLDGNGAIGFSDFLIFANSYGQQVPPSGGGATVTIPDANLRTVITDSLGKSRNASITRAEMATLTRIDAYNKGIRNLTGLEHATNLQRLGLGRVRVNDEWVNSNDISNLSPLSNLTNLTYLSLTSNSISDISELSNLTNLTTLALGDNSISDISALSNLTNLTGLYLWENSISSISALSNLTNLTYLSLRGNSISSISALSNLTNLERLWLYNNSILDISVLSNLTNLTYLGLSRNSILDISALSNLTNLDRLTLWDNNISSISALSNLTNLTVLSLSGNSISDISALSNLTNLTWLNLRDNSISSISVLSNLTNLTELGLGGNSISDISVLSNLTNLTILGLSDNSISDISALSNLTNLTELYLWDNSISSISALSNLTNLTGLRLWGNSISSISALSNLTNLTWLGLSDNSILDISALSNLTNLTTLYLWGNSISDISALSNLTNLKELYIGSISISDISSLSGLTNLTILFLDRNGISDISVLSNLTNLTGLYLYNNSISDISPLVANTGLGSGNTVNLRRNPLSSTSINTHIPALQRRGVIVGFDSSSGSGGGGSSPDLIVESPSVSDNTLTTGQSFTLSATVRNLGMGSSAETTLRYYRSSNATISTSDTEVGTDSVSGLSALGTSAESISLNAPSSAGTYYYGACVESVSGESDTNNNCSDGVSVTVSSSSSGGGGGSLGACRAGLVVNPNESCTYKDDYTFSVSSSGTGNIIGGGLFMSAGTGIQERGTINGVRWNFYASRNSSSNSWTIHTAE